MSALNPLSAPARGANVADREAAQTSLSAMVDAETRADEITGCLDRMKHDMDMRRCWSEYHLIGDCLRGLPVRTNNVFGQIAARLAAEPTVLAPRRRTLVPRMAVASFATLAVLGLVTLSGQNRQDAVNVAVAPAPLAPVADASEPQMPFEESRLAPYLVAHQEFSPMAVASPYQRATLVVAEGQR